MIPSMSYIEIPMSKRRKTKPAPRTTAKTCRDLGQQVRRIRQDKQITQKAIAAQVGMRAAQVSLLESGYNMETQFYARIARALGYRGALELFRAMDPQTTALLRLWDAMDSRTRELAYQKLKVWLLED